MKKEWIVRIDRGLGEPVSWISHQRDQLVAHAEALAKFRELFDDDPDDAPRVVLFKFVDEEAHA